MWGRWDGGTFYSNGSWKSWTPLGGQMVIISQAIRRSPPYYTDGSLQNGLSKYPKTALDGFYVGAAQYHDIERYVNTTLEWAKFSTNGMGLGGGSGSGKRSGCQRPLWPAIYDGRPSFVLAM